MEKYRYFTLREVDGKIFEYYRVREKEYDWWDDNVLDWQRGKYPSWEAKVHHTQSKSSSTYIQETSPLEMVVLLGKEAVRMIQ